ncbi:hypothetical protein KCU92_g3777, partial [Aureobasidium melanogenum]
MVTNSDKLESGFKHSIASDNTLDALDRQCCAYGWRGDIPHAVAAMSAVYTYTCENTSASYVGLCLQERIRLLGTSKAAAQNEQEWIANDSKIRWLQRSWTSMPTYADADL